MTTNESCAEISRRELTRASVGLSLGAVLASGLKSASAAPDKLQRAADERSGTYSVLVGVAANQCFATGQPVKIADLVKNVGRPSYPAMPQSSARVPMPPKV